MIVSSNVCNGNLYTIKKGDTLYKISRSTNVPLGDLIQANSNINIYNLQVGDAICIPNSEKQNNSNSDYQNNMVNDVNLNSSMQNNVNVNGSMKNEGDLNSSMDNNEGQNISTPNNMDYSNRGNYMENRGKWFVYIVKDGDTLEDVLDRYDLDLKTLMDANKQNRIMIKPGSVIIVPQ